MNSDSGTRGWNDRTYDETLYDSIQVAQEELQASVRWYFTAVAGVGAAILGGIALNNLSGLDVRSPRYWIAAITLPLIILIPMLLIHNLLPVLFPYRMTLNDLSEAVVRSERLAKGRQSRYQDHDPVLAAIEAEAPTLFSQVAPDLKSLLRETSALESRPIASRPNHKRRPDPNSLALKEAAQNVTAYANYYMVRMASFKLLRRSQWLIVALIVSVLMFSWATGARPAQVTEPFKATIALNDKGRRHFGKLLGSKCVAQEFQAVAVGGTLENPRVITEASGNCPRVRLRMEKDLGIAIPIPK
jgi:hypothetical protein